VFGIRLAHLDIREHAHRHRQALGELLPMRGDDRDYRGLGETARQLLLARALTDAASLFPGDPAALSPAAREVIDTFAALRDALSSGYRDALGSYVISGRTVPSDVLKVLLLMKEAGLAAAGRGHAALPIAPRFEFGASLRNAREHDGRCSRRPLCTTRSSGGVRQLRQAFEVAGGRLLAVKGRAVDRVGLGAVARSGIEPCAQGALALDLGRAPRHVRLVDQAEPDAGDLAGDPAGHQDRPPVKVPAAAPRPGSRTIRPRRGARTPLQVWGPRSPAGGRSGAG
jgi:Phosphoenolpyruvate carboxylase